MRWRTALALWKSHARKREYQESLTVSVRPQRRWSVDRLDNNGNGLGVPDPAVVHDLHERPPLRFVARRHRRIHPEAQHRTGSGGGAEALRPGPEHLPAAERREHLRLAVQ